LAIAVRWLGEDLLMSVHDNGKGLQPAKRGKSRGTSMLRERLALLESSASLTLGPPTADSPFSQGATAVVRLPHWKHRPAV
jgi:glucose-6-phosphate-specific signal transduction histidine kinase